MAELRLRSRDFRREREADWRRLEALLAKADSSGLGALDEAELYRLPALYRGALSSLSVARAISLDQALVSYLESLTARAYVFVYGSKRDWAGALAGFFRRGLPEHVRRLRRPTLAAALLLAAAVACGWVMTARDPDLYYGLVAEELAQGRTPVSSRQELLDVLENRQLGDSGGLDSLTLFASSLFSHNARVGMLCFALGAAFGLPVPLLVFTNGVTLGAMASIHARAGIGLEFWAWILPHGVTEILAICLCAGAGLHLGGALLFPGRHGRLAALAIRGREAAVVVAGAVLMFLLAGLIEGYFRQLVSGVVPRLALAVATAAVWIAYFGFAGRRPVAGGRS